jgi:hypothetical protein
MLHVVVPLVADFRAAFAQIELELDTDELNIDLLQRRTDVAIRIGPLRDSTLHARTLGTSRIRVMASPAYLAANGQPRGVAELAGHSLLGFTQPESLNRWPLRSSQGDEWQITPNLTASSGETLRQLALAGAGIVCLSDFMSSTDRANGSLVQVLARDTVESRQPISAVYYRNTQLAARIGCFLDFLQQRLGGGFGRFRLAGDLAQRLHKSLGRLAALDQVLVVDDHRRHRSDAVLLEELLLLAHFFGVLLAVDHRPRLLGVQPGLHGAVDQHLGFVRVERQPVIGLQQRALDPVLRLQPLQAGPVDQAVGIEGVPDATPAGRVEGETDGRAAFTDGLAVGRLLFGRGAVLATDMFGHVLSLGRHGGVQLERLEMDLGGHRALQLFERTLQAGQADGAPGAGHVGNKIDAQGCRHKQRGPRPG